MRATIAGFLILLGVMHQIDKSLAVPVSVLDASLSNNLSEDDDDEDDDNDDEIDSSIVNDDFTTHGLERLSSAATCLVAGVEYTHGQQIYRQDPCEFCLCLDGEMFCWWQDCPPTMEGPCRDRGPFSPCITVPANPARNKGLSKSKKTTILTTSEAQDPTSTLTSTTEDLSSTFEPSSTPSITSSTAVEDDAKTCLVMGKVYEVGEKLPHDTGNCLECICGPGAKITCSPHQCAPIDDEINDYRLPEARQPAQDLF